MSVRGTLSWIVARLQQQDTKRETSVAATSKPFRKTEGQTSARAQTFGDRKTLSFVEPRLQAFGGADRAFRLKLPRGGGTLCLEKHGSLTRTGNARCPVIRHAFSFLFTSPHSKGEDACRLKGLDSVCVVSCTPHNATTSPRRTGSDRGSGLSP